MKKLLPFSFTILFSFQILIAFLAWKEVIFLATATKIEVLSFTFYSLILAAHHHYFGEKKQRNYLWGFAFLIVIMTLLKTLLAIQFINWSWILLLQLIQIQLFIFSTIKSIPLLKYSVLGLGILLSILLVGYVFLPFQMNFSVIFAFLLLYSITLLVSLFIQPKNNV